MKTDQQITLAVFSPSETLGGMVSAAMKAEACTRPEATVHRIDVLGDWAIRFTGLPRQETGNLYAEA